MFCPQDSTCSLVEKHNHSFAIFPINIVSSCTREEKKRKKLSTPPNSHRYGSQVTEEVDDSSRMSSTSANRELETKASELNKLQKGKPPINFRFSCSYDQHDLCTHQYFNSNTAGLLYLDLMLSIYLHEKPNMLLDSSDIAKNHQVRKKYTIQLGENELVLKVLPPLSLVFLLFSSRCFCIVHQCGMEGQ